MEITVFCLFMFIIVSIRLSSLILSQRLFKIILFVIAIFCIREAFLGIIYFSKVWRWNSTLYPITGSFSNSGPYGGFMAICICLIFPACFKNSYEQHENIIQKLLFWFLYVSAISALIILPATQSRSALLALCCSSVAYVFSSKRLKTKAINVLKKAWMWLLPSFLIVCIGAYLFKKPSADGRFFIDKISIKAMVNNEGKGVGAHHFGGAYGETQFQYFSNQILENGSDELDWKAIDEHERLTSDCPEYAFNEYLNMGVEAGPTAMALFIFVIFFAIVISLKRGTIWCYGLISFAVFSLFSYPLQCIQFRILFPVLLACSFFDGLRLMQNKRWALISIYAIAFLSFSAYFIHQIPLLKKQREIEASWNNVRKWYKKEFYDYVVEDCDSLLPYMNNDREFLFDYGHSLYLTGNYAKSDSILIIGTKISCDPMFWNIMGNNSLSQGKFREAEECYKHAFYMVPNRLYPLYLLAKMYYIERDTTSFLDITEKVESFIPKIENTKTEKMRSEINDLKESVLGSF